MSGFYSVGFQIVELTTEYDATLAESMDRDQILGFTILEIFYTTSMLKYNNF
jgi:hypothetical protein